MVNTLDSCARAMRDEFPSEGTHRQFQIDIVHDDGDWSGLEPIAPLIARVAQAVARHVARPGPAAATLALSSDARVRTLNRSWRGQDKATNVLSFPAALQPGVPAAEMVFLGDIVLAAETLLREAAEAGVEPSHHCQHLVVHGLLHLLGYDHESEAEADVMEGLETRILAALGVSNPYSAHRGKREPGSQ